MITIQILEDNDIVNADDWCRPLEIESMSGGMSDHFSFRSVYSGTPCNNAKWVRVRDVFGKCWFGSKVGEFWKKGFEYEFIRGKIPEEHQLDMSEYNSADGC